MIRPIPSCKTHPGGQSPTGRIAPVTVIVGAGAHPQPVERARATNAMRNLTFAQTSLVRFLTEGEASPRFAFQEDIVPLLAIALHSVLDVERARLSAWQGSAARDRAERLAMAADHLMPALEVFEKEWCRG